MTTAESNAHKLEVIKQAQELGTYARAYTTTDVVHAVKGTVRGHGGHIHPRAFCQPHTPRVYASLINDQEAVITCKRCLAGIEKAEASA